MARYPLHIPSEFPFYAAQPAARVLMGAAHFFAKGTTHDGQPLSVASVPTPGGKAKSLRARYDELGAGM